MQNQKIPSGMLRARAQVSDAGDVKTAMKLDFNNAAYKLWLQEIMKQFVLTVRPGTNKWYLSHLPV